MRVVLTNQKRELFWINNNLFYYLFKIFPHFWLAKSTHIIHHNQLLITKFGRIFCLTRKRRQKCNPLQVNAPLTEKTWGWGWVVLVVAKKWRTLHSFQGQELTVAHNYHSKTKNLTAKTKYLTAKPKTSRQKQNTSRQNQKPHGKNKIPHDHGKTENFTSITKTSQQNQKPHGKNKIPHNKTKNLMAKPNTSQQKPNTLRQKQIPKAKPKLFCFRCEVFGFAMMFLFLPWAFWFCRDSCGPP